MNGIAGSVNINDKFAIWRAIGMHGNLAGAELREIGSIYVRTPDGAAVLATAHTENEVSAVSATGKPTGTHDSGCNVMDVGVVGRRARELDGPRRVVGVDDFAVGSPNDAGNTIGAADATGNLVRRRKGSGAAEVRNRQASGESYLGGGKRGAVGGDAGTVVEIQIIGDAANFRCGITQLEKLRVQGGLGDARIEKERGPVRKPGHLIGGNPVSRAQARFCFGCDVHDLDGVALAIGRPRRAIIRKTRRIGQN